LPHTSTTNALHASGSSFFSSLTSNWVAAISLIVIGFLLRSLVIWFGHWIGDGFGAFTGINKGSRSRLRVVYGLADSNPHPIAQDGDVSSLATALLMLSREHLLGDVTATAARSALGAFRSWRELLSISGPVWNPVSADIIRSAALGVHFSVGLTASGDPDDTLVIEQSDTDDRVLETIRRDGRPTECYGLVLVLHRRIPQSHRFQHAVVAGGISTLGTYGALHWLGELRHTRLDEVVPQATQRGLHDRWAVIKVVDSSPDGFTTQSSGSDSPAFLDLNLFAYGERVAHVDGRWVRLRGWAARSYASAASRLERGGK
jgi:hypothetical protein